MASRGLLLLMGCAVVVALAGAAAAGFYFGRSDAQGEVPVVDLFTAAQSRYTSYLFSVRRDGNDAAREDALRSYLSYLEMRARDKNAANEHVYAFDRALLLVRLSEIAQRRGATAEALRLTREAEAMCPSTGLHNCSANGLLTAARERDRRFLSGSAISATP